MKKIKYIILFIFAIGSFFSCDKEDRDVDLIKQGNNFVDFEQKSIVLSQVSETGDYTVDVQVKLNGPTTADVNGDITVTFDADPSSTAIEGTHYEWMDSKSIVLKQSENYLGVFQLKMKTAGIDAPSSAVLNLKITSVSGAANVVATAKFDEIKFTYVCPYHLGGTYNVHTVRSDGNEYDWVETISEIGVGTYLTQRVGTWDPPLNPNYGLLFYNACDKITVPQQNLADMYSNQVYGGGTYDEATGVIKITYTIEFSSGNMNYTSTYTPQ